MTKLIIMNYYRYCVKKKNVNKMISYINIYHFTGKINIIKRENQIWLNILSNFKNDFYNLLPNCEYNNLIDKMLILKSCIIISIENEIYLIKNSIEKLPNFKFHIFDGFSYENNLYDDILNELNIIHKEWKQQGMNGRLFKNNKSLLITKIK